MTRWQISDLPESARNKLPLATLKKPGRAKSKHPEYDEQVQVVKWWYKMKKIKKIPPHYHLVYTDTSAARTPAQRGRYKAMGGRAGILDLFIPVPVSVGAFIKDSILTLPRHYGGLWIEMKAPDRINEKDGGMSKAQVQFAKDMALCENKWVLCHTAKQAIDEITKYLGI